MKCFVISPIGDEGSDIRKHADEVFTLRDIERGSTTEGEHVLGDMATRARALGIETPILDLARCHVGAYEVSLARPQN